MSTVQIAQHLSPWGLFLQADAIVKIVMVLLALASLASWAVIADKLWRFRELRARAARWQTALAQPDGLAALSEALAKEPADPFARVQTAIAAEWDRSHAAQLTHTPAARDALKERIARVAQIAAGVEIEQLQRGLQLLATVGSVAPFVGLFGTVWGIINSFQGIASTNSTSLAVVAPGISEALFATALGLAAAIPAVVAYNRASGDLGAYANRLGTLAGIVEVELSRALEAGEARLAHAAGAPGVNPGGGGARNAHAGSGVAAAHAAFVNGGAAVSGA
ncbi:cell division and transport-associated protein TolQ [Trinickia symbiotica]|uniref:MotA/TolQ/ExbB proton channel family protein n=1 Tax=Trinickia symbiotica TaxID=863227 RepID=UPI0003783FDA|nr:MotA/TolQ/ExbB proton channel family protein [Trinickia symbiotica]PPK47075.1 cell division and transport-associated protein TolQ [Trinickia symbiotica]